MSHVGKLMSVWRILFLTDRKFGVTFHKHSQNDENHFCTYLCSNLKHCAAMGLKLDTQHGVTFYTVNSI